MSSTTFNHALVVGGSGMLAEVSLYLTNTGTITSVIGRDPTKIKRLQELSFIYPGKVNPIISDYTDRPQFIIDVIMAEQEFGPINLAVVWIHGKSNKVLFQLASLLNHNSCRFIHVLSSDYGDSNPELDKLLERFSRYENIDYHPTILGYKTDGESRRWLTDKEISSGVIEALQSDLRINTVGENSIV